MTNWYDNVVYLTRNTSLTPPMIDEFSFIEFQMYLETLSKKLEEEAEERKKEERKQKRSNSFNSMYSQMKSWLGRSKKS